MPNTKVYKVLGTFFEVPENYEIVEGLGSGAYGCVVAARDTNFDDPENEFIAIKKLETIFEHEIYCKRTLRELKIMRLLDHPNILSIQQILEPPKRQKDFKSLYLILDQMETDLG